MSEALAVTPVKSVGPMLMFALPLKLCPAMVRAVSKVVAVVAFPERAAVIVPALKFPLPSLATIAFAVFESVAVVAELETFPEVEIVSSFVSAIAALELISAFTIEPAVIAALNATAPVPSKETAAAVTSPVIEKF